MLTKIDLQLIGELLDKKLKKGFGDFRIEIDQKFDDFAVLMQNEFSNIYNRFDKVDERLDGIEGRLDNVEDSMATKTDITRLEHKFEGRLERAEDNIRVIKTKLKLS